MITYVERSTGEMEVEKIYGEGALRFVYGKTLFGKITLFLLTRIPLFSRLYGWWQRQRWTRRKIIPFIQTYGIDTSEFLEPVEHFSSFDAFFCRKLKPERRPLAPGEDRAVIPADGRFLVYPNVEKSEGFIIKGKRFSLSSLLCNPELAEQYAKGSMVIGRLCPTDYHRFHFPCTCKPGKARLIQGTLFSVNPLSLKQRIGLLTENKRSITEIETERFGKLLFVEIGATNVGAIHQTYTPDHPYEKGEEKGFFSFGGSALILLFEEKQIQFEADLLQASAEHLETRCLMGQSLGKKG